jgi:T5SS/PEP-CTERM-associated repeat protein
LPAPRGGGLSREDVHSHYCHLRGRRCVRRRPGRGAATITWNNAAGGSYTTASNWSPATVPTSTSDVVFDLPYKDYTVAFPTGSNRTNRSALIDSGGVTFNIGGATRNYTLTGDLSQQDLVVGKNSTATLTLTNGKLTTPSTRIGFLSGSNGTLNVSTGATLDSDTYFIEIGGSGTGRLNVHDGGAVLAADGLLGTTAGSNGLLSVDGSGSTWTGTNSLVVGRDGSGTLAVTQGGAVTTVYGVIGQFAGSTGTAKVSGSGSAWTNSGDLYVGGNSSSAGGTGFLEIGGNNSWPILFPTSAEAGVTVTIGGELKIWASGTVNLNDGGTLDVTSINKLGTFNFNAGTLDIDNFTVGSSGLFGSSYSLGSGRTMVVDNTLTIDAGSTLSLDGGSLDVTSITRNGTLNFNAGTLDIDNFTVGSSGLFGSSYSLGSGRTMVVDNVTTIDAGSSLVINGGNFTTGSLVKNGSFQFLSGSIDLGSTPLTLGAGDTFSIGAGSSFVNTGNLTVDPGSTFLVDGGTFTNTGNLAFNTGSSVTINGGILDVGGNATLGNGTTLTLNGGTINVANILGINPGGTVSGSGTFTGGSVIVNGTLNLTGNSDFQNAVVSVGNALGGGTGQINVAAGTTTDFYSQVYVNGDGISVGAGGEAIYHDYLGGGGTLGGAGTHTALGQVGPGNSPGLLTVEGDFVFEDTATFDIEMNGLARGVNPGYDAMDVGGEAWLDGTLQVTLLDGFTPTLGDSFDVLLAEVLHGTFGTVVLPGVTGVGWQIEYLLNAEGVDTLRLSAQSAVPVPGAVWMLLSALGGLAYARRRQRLH